MILNQSGIVFDPETIELLRESLEGAWSRLAPAQRARTSRTTLAERILTAAVNGERDPIRLQARALIGLAPSEKGDASV
jgi:hypothetical protein